MEPTRTRLRLPVIYHNVGNKRKVHSALVAAGENQTRLSASRDAVGTALTDRRAPAILALEMSMTEQCREHQRKGALM